MINPQPCDLALAGEELIGVHCARGKARLAEGIEAVFTHNGTTGIGHNANQTKKIFWTLIQYAVRRSKT